MTEYVVCPACGTRIKAGRGHCLRCFELLPQPGTPRVLAIWESLGWSQRAQVTFAAAASLAVVTLAMIIWRTRTPEVDDVARAAPTTATAVAIAPPRAPAPAAVAAVVEDTPPEPVHAGSEGDEPFFDLPRAASHDDGTRYEETLAHFKLARTAVDRGHWTRAIAEYGAATSLAQDDASALYNFALALHRRGDERDAIAAFHKAIALAPDEAIFHLPLAVAFENVGQIGDAANEYRKFLAAAPDTAAADRARSRLEALSTGSPGPQARR